MRLERCVKLATSSFQAHLTGMQAGASRRMRCPRLMDTLCRLVRKTTTQQRATGTELGTDTKPTLEVAGVPSRPRAAGLAWSERPLCSSCGSSSSPCSTDTAWAPAWGGASLVGGVARVPYSGTRGSANLPDTAL